MDNLYFQGLAHVSVACECVSHTCACGCGSVGVYKNSCLVSNKFCQFILRFVQAVTATAGVTVVGQQRFILFRS